MKDGEAWNANEDFWDALEGFVSRDGWATHENHSLAFAFFRDLRKEGSEELEGEEKAAFDKRTQWVADCNGKGL